MQDWTIDIRIEKNHLITEIDGQLLLLDTGAPHSFGLCSIEWESEQVDLSTQMPPIPFSILQERVGLPLVGLIGCNHLLHRGMRLDIPNSTLTLHDEVPCDADACPLYPIMNVPTVTIDVGGVPQKIIIDTGAMQTFIDKRTAEGLQRVGSVRDFMPTGDVFTAALVEMEAIVDQRRVAIQPAVSPDALDPLLEGVAAAGIIGLDVLRTQAFEFAPTIGYMSPAIRLNRIPSDEAETFIGD